MHIVDTPGTNVILERQQRLTEEYVPRADLVLFVMSVDRAFSESEVGGHSEGNMGSGDECGLRVWWMRTPGQRSMSAARAQLLVQKYADGRDCIVSKSKVCTEAQVCARGLPCDRGMDPAWVWVWVYG